jgi:hypothetical protein
MSLIFVSTRVKSFTWFLLILKNYVMSFLIFTLLKLSEINFI